MGGFVKWVVSHLGWWWFGRWGCGPFGPFGPFGRLRAGRLRMALRAGRRRSPYVLAGKPKFG